MKAAYLVLLVFGLAAAKPYESLDQENENLISEFVDKIVKDADPSEGPSDGPTDRQTDGPTDDYGPTGRPTDDYGPTGRPTYGPTDDYGPTGGPTDKPMKDFWDKFAHFLFVKSVQGVKPDEHPDLKYKEPLGKLVDQLLVVKKEVVKALKPIVQIAKLMRQDQEEMGKRVYEAAKNNDIEKAKHIAGEYFIAIQRRFAMFIVHATQKGLFDNIDEEKKEIENLKREYKEHADKHVEMVKFILKNFNQFRVSDGLLDAPFVRLGVRTAQVFGAAGMQGAKVFKVSTQVYMDIISKLVWLSLENNNHDAAVRAAGASLLSFTRRGTKVGIVLHRMYGPKKCYGPKPKKGRKNMRKDDDEDDLDY